MISAYVFHIRILKSPVEIGLEEFHASYMY